MGWTSWRKRARTRAVIEHAVLMERLEGRRLMSVSVSASGMTATTAGSPFEPWALINGSSSNPHHEAEMTVAISPVANPNNGKQVIAELTGMSATNQLHLDLSVDGGSNWTETTIDNSFDGLGGFGRYDPSCAFDGQGSLYLSYVQGNVVQYANVVRIKASLIDMTTGGISGTANVASISMANQVDAPFVCAGPNPTNSDQEVYLSAGAANGLEYWHGDQTATFSPAGFSSAGTNTTTASRAVVNSANGDFFLLSGSTVYRAAGGLVATSGVLTTMSTSVPSASAASIAANTSGSDRASRQNFNNPPVIGVDANTGKLYLAWQSAAASDVIGGTVDSNIFVSSSSNNGSTWSTPSAIDGSAATQFMPALAVDPSNGVPRDVHDDRRQFAEQPRIDPAAHRNPRSK